MDKATITNSLKAIGAPSNSNNAKYLGALLKEGESVKAHWEGISGFAVVTTKRLLTFKNISGQYTTVPLGNIQGFSIIPGGTFKYCQLQVNLTDGSTLNIKGGSKPKAYPSTEFFTETLNNLFASKKFAAGAVTEGKVDSKGRIAEGADDDVDLVTPLEPRTEKVLKENLSPNEEILAQIMGNFHQALVLTNKRLYLVKVGFMTGQTFGGKCIAYEYRNITGVEIKKHATSNILMILTPSSQDSPKLSYWGQDGNDANKSDFAITFSDVKRFQMAVNMARDLMSMSHAGGTQQMQSSSGNDLDQLEKLAGLKEKGIITQQEFDAKKKQLLGL